MERTREYYCDLLQKEQHSFARFFHQCAQQEPDKKLFTFLNDIGKEKETVTAGSLNAMATAVGMWLRTKLSGATDHGMGERVILLCNPGLEFVVSFLGCMYEQRCVAVPCYPPLGNTIYSIIYN
jgi:acyl-CoA synthetase (AMP-forming)/AMP-acid ligase II